MKHRAAVLGAPIGHSRSPILHRAAYAALDLDWTYDAIEMTPGELPGFLASLDDSWIGLSLTMPLKVAVLPLLNEVTPLAEQAGAVNTVTLRGNHRRGDNTDVPAMKRLIGQAGEDATVLGAGATARSAVCALAQLGTERVTCWARRHAAAEELAAYARALGMQARAIDGAPEMRPLQAPIVVSALPGDAASGWAELVADVPGHLIDVSYDPWPPPLTEIWPSHRTTTGIDLLLEQAALQIQQWTGLTAPRDAMRAALISTMPERAVD